MSKFRLIILAFIIISCFTGSVYAQGDYLRSGQSGFMAGVGFATNEQGHTASGGASFSIGGALDFGLDYGHFTGDGDFPSLDAVYGSVIVHILSSDYYSDFEMPISVSIGGAYGSEWNDDIDSDIYRTFGWLYRNLRVSPTVSVQPNFSVTYYRGSMDVKRPDNTLRVVDIDNTDIAFGLSLFVASSEKLIFRFESELRLDDDLTTFGFRFSPMFITADKNK